MVLLGHFSKLLCSGTMPEEERGRRDDLGGRLVCVCVWGGGGGGGGWDFECIIYVCKYVCIRK